MIKKCKVCGSFAINHHLHGRDGSDDELCDVCFWVKRAKSHDELVKRLAVMTELVGKMNCYCRMSGLSAKSNSENPVESWMYGADEALDAIRSAS